MRSYEAARVFCSTLAFVSWSIIIVGFLIAIGAGSAVSQIGFGAPSGTQVLLAALPGLALSMKYLGLAVRFRRSERKRQPLIFQRVLFAGAAVISVAWPNDKMAGVGRSAAPALPR